MEKIMNPLRALAEKGQSVWLDFLSREIIENGELKKLIDDDGDLRKVDRREHVLRRADQAIHRQRANTGRYDIRASGHRRYRRRRRPAAAAL
jgi:hypothetical protein